MESLVIDIARAEHLADIPGIELAGATLFAESDLPQRLRHRVTAAEDLQEALLSGRLWTAVLNGHKTVGFAMAETVDGQAYLTEVDVLPEYGRQGIGTKLVRTVAHWAGNNGFCTLSLITFHHLPWNAPFYEKIGFTLIDPMEHGPELAGLIQEERQVGIDTASRVAMKMRL